MSHGFIKFIVHARIPASYSVCSRQGRMGSLPAKVSGIRREAIHISRYMCIVCYSSRPSFGHTCKIVDPVEYFTPPIKMCARRPSREVATHDPFMIVSTGSMVQAERVNRSYRIYRPFTFLVRMRTLCLMATWCRGKYSSISPHLSANVTSDPVTLPNTPPSRISSTETHTTRTAAYSVKRYDVWVC